MFGAHLQRAFRRAAKEQAGVGLLMRLDVGVGALDAVELAAVIERAVAGPHLAHHFQIFAGATVTVILGQEVALARLILVAGAGDDVQRHPALRELVEGRDLPRGQRRRHRARPVRDQEFDPFGVVGSIERDAKTFGRRSVISDEDGIIVPLLVQPGEVDHPLARNLALDQVNRDPFLLGADHTGDLDGHGFFPDADLMFGRMKRASMAESKR